MPPDPLISKSISICQVTCLGTIFCGENDGVSLFRQLIDDRLEKRNVWRVIQINPYRFLLHLFSRHPYAVAKNRFSYGI